CVNAKHVSRPRPGTSPSTQYRAEEPAQASEEDDPDRVDAEPLERGEGGERQGESEPVRRVAPSARQEHRQAEEDREIEDDSDDGGGDSRKGRREAPVAAETLNVRGAEQDVEEAGEKSHVRRNESAERGARQTCHPL